MKLIARIAQHHLAPVYFVLFYSGYYFGLFIFNTLTLSGSRHHGDILEELSPRPRRQTSASVRQTRLMKGLIREAEAGARPELQLPLPLSVPEQAQRGAEPIPDKSEQHRGGESLRGQDGAAQARDRGSSRLQVTQQKVQGGHR